MKGSIGLKCRLTLVVDAYVPINASVGFLQFFSLCALTHAICNVCVLTQRRSVAKSVGCFQRRLFVCLFVNMITSERVNTKWWNLGGGHCTKISAELEVGGHSLPGCAPPKCGVRLRRWENQRRLSSSSIGLKCLPISTVKSFIMLTRTTINSMFPGCFREI